MSVATDEERQANQELLDDERNTEKRGLHGPPTKTDLPKPSKTMTLTEDEITAYARGQAENKRVLTREEIDRVAKRHMELTGAQQAGHSKEAHNLKMHQRKAEVEKWEAEQETERVNADSVAPVKRGPGRPPGTGKKQQSPNAFNCS